MHGPSRIRHDNRVIPHPSKQLFLLSEYGDAETALAAADGHLRGFLTLKPEARPSDYTIAPMDLHLDGLGHAYVIRIVR